MLGCFLSVIGGNAWLYFILTVAIEKASYIDSIFGISGVFTPSLGERGQDRLGPKINCQVPTHFKAVYH